MPSNIFASIPTRTISIDVENGAYAALGVEHPDILELIQSVTTIHEHMPLTSVMLKRVGPSWNLDINRVDGLRWREDYRLDPATNEVQLQTSVNQWWLFADMMVLRRFRDILTKLLGTNVLIEFEFTYT